MPVATSRYLVRSGPPPTVEPFSPRRPRRGDEVTVAYTGKLDDGTVFDSGKITFPVGTGRVIKGWDKAVVKMRVGETKQVTIPPGDAYGPSGAGPIPPNATLHFRMTLVSVKRG